MATILDRFILGSSLSLSYYLEWLANKVRTDKPLGTSQTATSNTYLELANKARAQDYPEVDCFEKKMGYAVSPEWLHNLALHTQIVIKESPLCYAHGRVLYSALSRYLSTHVQLSANQITILETGTARGFSALCMAKALQDFSCSGRVVTFDLLPHLTSMYWNCIDDIDGPKTRSQLLQPWNDLTENYIIFLQGDTRIALPRAKVERINFAFLDGTHSYEQVTFEFKQIAEHQKHGDIVVFDDYSPSQYPELVRAVDESCDRNNYKMTVIRAHQVRGYALAIRN